jgi:hypothetical protein
VWDDIRSVVGETTEQHLQQHAPNTYALDVKRLVRNLERALQQQAPERVLLHDRAVERFEGESTNQHRTRCITEHVSHGRTKQSRPSPR